MRHTASAFTRRRAGRTDAARARGDKIRPLPHAYLGPESSNAAIEATLQRRGVRYERVASITDVASDRLAAGEVVAWFQGRLAFGPRALGNRRILGNPAHPGIGDKIGLQIKFHERWRPFCPSLLDRAAPDILQSTQPSPHMTFTFDVAESWKTRSPGVAHEAGAARPQIGTPLSNRRYDELIENFAVRTHIPVLLNTSLNRRREPLGCSPDDALNMFDGCDLRILALGDFLVHKSG